MVLEVVARVVLSIERHLFELEEDEFGFGLDLLKEATNRKLSIEFFKTRLSLVKEPLCSARGS